MIELAILGALSEQNLHGYELKKQLADLLGPWSTMSFGSLYPALARLEKGRLVLETIEPDEPGPGSLPELNAPMTGALSGELAAFRNRLAPRTKTARGRRGKKVYGITAAGGARLHELLTAPRPDDERTFALRVAFCRHLDPAERLALFERRKAEITAQVHARRRPHERRSDPYLRSLRDRDSRALTHDLAWLDELIAAARADATDAVGPAHAHPEPDAEANFGAAAIAAGAPNAFVSFRDLSPSASSLTIVSPKAGIQP